MTKKPRNTDAEARRVNRKPRAGARKAPRSGRAGKAGSPAHAPAQPTDGRPGREGTKQAELIALLRRPDGATIADAMAATGWQSHTVRGAIAGALKKKLGLAVTSQKVDGRGRVYRIAD